MFLDIHDYIESEPVDKEIHEWQQSTVEAEYIIEHLTVENESVLDPFMGSGTTGLAALKLNRKFVGIEKDKDHFRNANSNISRYFDSSILHGTSV